MEHKVAFSVFIYKYLEPADVALPKGAIYRRYFAWLKTVCKIFYSSVLLYYQHISSQETRFLGVNLNGMINAKAPHTALAYHISSSQLDWKALGNVQVGLSELNSVFPLVWGTIRNTRSYFSAKVR